MNQEERRKRRERDTRKAVIVFVLFLFFMVLLIAGVVFGISKYILPQMQSGTDTEQTEGQPETEEPSEEPVVDVTPPVDPYEEQAAGIVAGMSLEDKLAQMFVITPNALTGYSSVTAAGDTTREAYNSRPVGGIIYMGANLTDPEQTKTMLSNMQAIARERTGLPIFLCVDEEGGSVARIASNSAFSVTDVGKMSDIGATGDTQNAYNAGAVIGTYLTDLGFNVDFAPVADVLTNPENTVIGDRSFGSDPQLVAGMVTSELQALSDMGVYGAVKHFPGHGGTTEDSHEGAATTERALEEMMQSELVPFQSAIDAGVPFVMVGHISVPNVTGTDVPATLSSYMVTDVLRGRMGYRGIIITDAMDMGAITDNYNSDAAAVTAVVAGVDMILMPDDYETAYNGLLTAVQEGTISEERINESVIRIVRAKLMMQ